MSTIQTELGELIEALYDAALKVTGDQEQAALCVSEVLESWFSESLEIPLDTEAA